MNKYNLERSWRMFIKYVTTKWNKAFEDRNAVDIKRAMYYYLTGDERYNALKLCNIYKIKVKTTSYKIHITVTLERLGYFIGKRGDSISALSKYLEGKFNQPIQFHLIEHNPWK